MPSATDYKRKHSKFFADVLLEVLADGEEHTAVELVVSSGYKDKTSLKNGVSSLRGKGKDIISLHVDGHLKYKMIILNKGNRWSCMIPKDAWPVCKGTGCRHIDSCGAVIRRGDRF